jgi:hypothetical protein
VQLYWLALGALGVWRITHLLNAEDGPWDVMVRLREHAGSGFWASLLDCFYCLSLWIALPFACAIGASGLERLLLWPALSAAAIFAERLISLVDRAPAVQYMEETENQDELLRETASTATDDDHQQTGGER